jgi:diguanylate cyclase (GGDEF)-like protein/PAS domain S-box-containing protein
MDPRKDNAQNNNEILTHEIEQLRHELQSVKQQLATEIQTRQELENNFLQKETQWEIEKKYNPVGILLWEKQGEDYLLKEYNQVAHDIFPEKLTQKLGLSPQDIFIDNPEICEGIRQCAQEKKVIERELDQDIYINFKCVFLHPNQIILYYQFPQSCLKLEEKLQHQIEQESVISLFARKALAIVDMSQLMEETVTIIAQCLKVDYARILELLPNGAAFLLKAGWGWKKDLIGTATVSAGLNSQAGYVLAHKTPVITEDLRVDPLFKGDPLLHNNGVISGVSVIVSEGENTYGVLQVHSSKFRQFNQDDVHFLQAIAKILAIAIERDIQREKLNLLERAIDVSSNSIFMVDALGENNPISYVNSGFERLTGYRKQDIINQSYTILNEDEADAPIMEEIKRAMVEGKEFSTTMRTYREDNTVFWNDFYLSPIHNLQGHLTHFIGVQTDITERKCIQESLEMTQFCLDRAKDGVFWLHAKGYFIYVNDAACELLGYTKQELLSLKASEIGHYAPSGYGLKQLSNKDSLTFETQHRCKDGSILPVEISVNYLEFNEQKYNCAFVRDISERKKAELDLRESEEKFRGIFEQAAVGIAITSPSGKFLAVNPGICEWLGYTSEELMQLTMEEIIHPEEIELDHQDIEELINNSIEEFSKEKRYLRKDGNLVWGQITVSLIRDLMDTPRYLVGVITDITERKKTEAALVKSEKALRESEERLDSILSSLEDIVWSADPRTFEYIYINPAIEKVYGYPVTEFFQNGRLWINIVHPEDKTKVEYSSLELSTKGVSKDIEYRIIRADGEIRWIRDRARMIYDREGKALRMDGIAVDVTERKNAEYDLKKSEEQFRRTFELAPIGMAITDLKGKYEKVNNALCDALNYSKEELLDRRLSDIDITHPEDIATDMAFNKRLLRGEISHFQREKRYLAKDDRIVNVLLQVVLVQDRQGNPIHVVRQIVDITQRKKMEERLLYSANHDVLTGLPNRMLFIDRLQKLLKIKKENSDYLFAVLFLDLDRFKMVNDSMGHSIGDKLLMAISHKLLSCVRTEDTVARFGGDEFTILLRQISSKEEASAIAERIHQSLKNPFLIEGYEIFTSASIGIALADVHYEKPEEMLRDADLTMYHAKETGRSRHEIFDHTMYQQIRSRLELETDLRKAIQQKEFVLNYQPILNLKTGALVGFEALIRWQNPHRGFVSPMYFIPIAEETGLIVSIGEWVLEEACRQMTQWKNQFPQSKNLTISVNLSGRQIKEIQLINKIDEIVLKTQFEAHRLKLEITESILMENMEETTLLFQQLRDRQIKLSMDDFGTGYSSLSYLHRFPMNTLKIDRAFVSPIENDSQKHHEIIQAIITLAHAFKMDVVAEGIETETQVTKLKKLGCEYGQGYFFDKPLKALEIEQKYFN